MKSVDGLELALASADSMIEKCNFITRKHVEEIESLRQQLAEAKKDAERYKDLLGKANALARIRWERIAELTKCIERMRVAGGSQEFQMAFELAKDAIAPHSDHHGADWTDRDGEYLK